MNNYITPITEIASSFKEAKDRFSKFGHHLFYDEIPIPITDLTKGTRNMVIGEPGIGKTELMKKLKENLDTEGFKTIFLQLRFSNSIDEIKNFLKSKSKKPKAIFLDALDESPRPIFQNILKKISEVSDKHPDLSIYISSRWVFMEKYAESFSDYRFIIIKPFTTDQIREYLLHSSKTKPEEINKLFQHITGFHSKTIIQIPRYLFLFKEYITDKAISEIQNISRNELFEHFIYNKLSLEAKNNPKIEDMEPAIKRLLEKLALTMEIYQTNSITREELVTFFDDIKSDLKLMIITQVGINILLKNSVLQPSKEDINRIEFDNAEFQEYLAAKEITRLAEPRRATFSFATNSSLNEIYPSWFNTLSFLADMDPDIVEQLLDFSGINSEKFTITDESFFVFLSRINPKLLNKKTKKRIFIDTVTYHNLRLQWLSHQITSSLSDFYDQNLEVFLKEKIDQAENENPDTAKYYVPIGNIFYVISYLLESDISIDKVYWRSKLIKHASAPYVNGVLPRHALLALANLKDETVIDELPDLTKTSDELVMRGYISMCGEIAPNKKKSIDAFINLIKANDISGHYGLFKVNERRSLKHLLRTYNNDDLFRKEFLDDASIFRNKDSIIVKHIRSVADDELRKLSLEAVVKSIHYSISSTHRKSYFITDLISYLKDTTKNFIEILINEIKSSENSDIDLYFSQEFFKEILLEEDVETYIKSMLGAGVKDNVLMQTLTQIKLSDRENASAIYEAGRSTIPEIYSEFEQAQKSQPKDYNKINDERLIAQFRKLLEPAPGMYSDNIFYYYNSHREKLEELMSQKDRKRLDKILQEFVLSQDPLEHGFKINYENDNGQSRNYTASSIVKFFGDALITSRFRDINLKDYRKNLINFIPFANKEVLEILFEEFPNLKSEEVDSIIKIYSNKEIDLWRWQPDAFIETVKNYNLVNAIPILKDFVEQEGFRINDRIDSLLLSESLKQDSEFLKKIFNRYVKSKNKDVIKLSYISNGLLITKYLNIESINWRINQIKERVQPINTSHRKGVIVRNIDDFEYEINHSKEFARPLMELRQSGFESEYLNLLDFALELWSKGEEYSSYAKYLWDIVFTYFDNLKNEGSYDPLKMLEGKISSIGDKQEGANWLAYKMVKLRRSYLEAIGKPSSFTEAINKYNLAQEYKDKEIVTSADLVKHLQDALDTDLRSWIEGEGAYELILFGKVYKSKVQEYEKLIQKTIKAQIESSMLKRGFQIEVLREPDLLDDKRVDLLVRYGFVGPIILEVKLTTNSDLQRKDLAKSKSYMSLERYMKGYGAKYGIFLVIVNNKSRKVPEIRSTFEKIEGVTTISIDCAKFIPPKKNKSGSKKKK